VLRDQTLVYSFSASVQNLYDDA